MNLADLGKRIRSQREKKRLTQALLANSLHISAQAVSKWERGENAPDIAVLKPLSTILDRSIEWILTGNNEQSNMFKATVLCTSLRDFATHSQTTSLDKIVLWINGLFHTITEAVLAQDGVPIKYTGDGFLCYFSGSRHEERAFSAAQSAAGALQDEAFLATLCTGSIYLGAIGHHNFSQADIMGECVNHVFMMNRWATDNCSARIVLSETTASKLESLPNTKIDTTFKQETLYLLHENH